ncbi:Hypothetical predicted protein [Cloeon dipterum]|uniref:Uncharacterized protein n=2 Tax=Cloeon dipterum TaxID=197152 RepID=A0A8S1E0F6_9INSE|nr:Hypothetical predicted protein [Cloeon dipterum]
MSLQKELCLICDLPTADGAVLAVHVDKEKLDTWILNVCGHELAEEIEDHDLICYFCLWHAEFQWKFDEMEDESLVWWPRNSEYLDDAAKELRKNYFEGKVEQCWPFGIKRCVLLSYSENQHSYKKMSFNELLNNLWIACKILFAPIVALIVVIIELIFCCLITDGSTKEVDMNERNIRRERKRFWRAIRIENRLLSGKDSDTDSTLSQDGTEEDEDMNRRENNFIRFMCLPEPGLFCIRISSMSDLQRLSLAKSRLNNLRKNKSLFDLTAKKIVKSFETFISDEREDDMKRIQRLPTLPACLRQKLLDGLCELTSTTIGVDKQMQELKRIFFIFTHLLCPQIQEITLNGMLTFSPEHYRETALSQILLMIAIHAPNVLSLTLSAEKSSCEQFELFKRAQVETLGRLKKLRKLKLDSHQVKYAEAKEICKQLPHLTYFDVRLDMSDKSIVQENNIEDFKEAFSQLKVFLFPSEWWCDSTRYLFKRCLQHLPQLEVVQGCVCSSLYAPTLASPDNFGDSLQPSALCYLNVDWKAISRPWHLKFPNVRHLHLEGNYGVSMEYIKPVLQFKKIESLELNDFGGKEEKTLIKTYGHNLHTLQLVFLSSPPQIELKTIFSNCPKLQTIVLQFTWVTSDSTKNAFLSNILQAPTLETISLSYENYDVEDLKAVSALIAEKKILRQLRKFQFISSLIEMESVNKGILCLVCERPTADGAFLAVHANKGKLRGVKKTPAQRNSAVRGQNDPSPQM